MIPNKTFYTIKKLQSDDYPQLQSIYFFAVSSATLLRRGTPNGASSGSSSGSSVSHRLIVGGPGCSTTLGRVKNLEMTEYQKEKLINEANTVKIKVM